MTTNYEKHTSSNPIQRLLLENFYKEALKMLEGIKPESILDVGAGEGFTIRKLKTSSFAEASEGQAKLKIIGVDNSEESVKLAKKLHPDLDIRLGSIYNLEFKDNSFDVVIATEVLEHLDKPVQGLNELKRVSKRYLLLSVPNEPWFTIQRFLRGKNIKQFGAHPEHIQWWTRSAFIKFLEENKLEILEIKTPFAWTLVLAEK